MDEIDFKILNILQKNCRESLTKIAKETKISVDTVKKRLDKMIKEDIFFPKIQLRPRNFGFNNVIEIKIKIKNYTQNQLEEFIQFLKKEPRVVEIIKQSGEWDFTLVILAKNAIDQGQITNKIRSKFIFMIDSWIESLTTCTYKFEDYDMESLIKNG